MAETEKNENLEFFGLPPVATTTAVKYNLIPVDGKPRYLEGVARILMKEFASTVILNGYLPLDEAFQKSKDPNIVKLRDKFKAEKINRPYCGRNLYLVVPKLNTKFKTGVAHYQATKNENFLMFVDYCPYQSPAFYPLALQEILSNIPEDKMIEQGAAAIENYFKESGYTTQDVSCFLTENSKNILESVIKAFVKNPTEDTTIPQSEVLIGFVARRIGDNTKKKKPEEDIKYDLNVDDIFVFKSPKK